MMKTPSPPRLWIYGLLTVALAARICVGSGQVAVTRLGRINGTSTVVNGTTVYKYLGIPYAKPPVGEKRLRKPEPAGALGNFSATDFGPVCPQMKDGKLIGEEDCLTLNVYTPDTATVKSVMIWIHGGSFLFGSGSQDSGEALAAEQDVVVVTINYRLNVLGFLTSGDDKLPGNYGLWDQRLAIQWVKDNIGDYGGDNSSITLFGESAGGRSTTFQMMSPRNNGSLFQRVIAESGSALSLTYINRDPSEVLTLVLRRTGCHNAPALLDCLQSLPLAKLLDATKDIARPFPFFPIVDGDFLPSDLGHLLANFTADRSSVAAAIACIGQYDLLAGWNNQEGLMYLNRLKGNSANHDLSTGATDTALTLTLQQYPFYKYGGENNLAVVELFKSYYLSESSRGRVSDGRSDSDKRVEAYVDIAGDIALKLPVIQLLQMHSYVNTSRTYAYEFQHKRSWPVAWYEGPDWLRVGADHTDEIAYVLGYPFLDAQNRPINANFTQDEKALSRRLMNYWGGFAKTGNPGNNLTQFAFPGNQEYTQISEQKDSVDTFPLNDRLRLWSAVDAAVILGQRINPDTPATNRTGSVQVTAASGLITLTAEEAGKVVTGLIVGIILVGFLLLVFVFSLLCQKISSMRRD